MALDTVYGLIGFAITAFTRLNTSNGVIMFGKVSVDSGSSVTADDITAALSTHGALVRYGATNITVLPATSG